MVKPTKSQMIKKYNFQVVLQCINIWFTLPTTLVHTTPTHNRITPFDKVLTSKNLPACCCPNKKGDPLWSLNPQMPFQGKRTAFEAFGTKKNEQTLNCPFLFNLNLTWSPPFLLGIWTSKRWKNDAPSSKS